MSDSSDSKINELSTKFAVMDNRLKNVVDNVEELKTTTRSNHEDILARMDSFAFVSLADFNGFKFKTETNQREIDITIGNLQKDLEKNYRKKTDGQTLRNIGIGVATAIAISFASLLFNFIISGGLRNVQ